MRPPRANPSAAVRSLEVGEEVFLVVFEYRAHHLEPPLHHRQGEAKAEIILPRVSNSGPDAYFPRTPRCCELQ